MKQPMKCLILHIKKFVPTLHKSLQKGEAFPYASLHVSEMGQGDIRPNQEFAKALLSINTRPFPERIDALIKFTSKPFTRQKIDAVFALCENISESNLSTNFNFDFDCERLTKDEVLLILDEYPASRVWIQNCLHRFSLAYGFPLKGDIFLDAKLLLNFLSTEISLWEADSFPLDCMAYLKNRYNWTFMSKAWSLREQLRQEALIIEKSWHTLLKMAKEQPLLFIINGRAPDDYFTSFLPEGAALFSDNFFCHTSPILIYQGLKISSSEHRVSLTDTLEGKNLFEAMKLAQTLGRRPVLCDFSRRKFPRSFLRVARFALEKKFGIFPMGKLFDPETDKIPEAKSATGFPIIKGKNTLTLFDPWPVSDPEILKKICEQEKRFFCHAPLTKPWQDDRIGARVEIEPDENGIYKVIAKPWPVPVLGGWMRADTLFKSRLGRFLDK